MQRFYISLPYCFVSVHSSRLFKSTKQRTQKTSLKRETEQNATVYRVPDYTVHTREDSYEASLMKHSTVQDSLQFKTSLNVTAIHTKHGPLAGQPAELKTRFAIISSTSSYSCVVTCKDHSSMRSYIVVFTQIL
jgi:hypothetical protein